MSPRADDEEGRGRLPYDVHDPVARPAGDDVVTHSGRGIVHIFQDRCGEGGETRPRSLLRRLLRRSADRLDDVENVEVGAHPRRQPGRDLDGRRTLS